MKHTSITPLDEEYFIKCFLVLTRYSIIKFTTCKSIKCKQEISGYKSIICYYNVNDILMTLNDLDITYYNVF